MSWYETEQGELEWISACHEIRHKTMLLPGYSTYLEVHQRMGIYCGARVGGLPHGEAMHKAMSIPRSKLPPIVFEVADDKKDDAVSILELMSLMEESACGLEWCIRTTCPPVPEDDEMIFSYEEVRYHIGWWDKPRIRIPRFLADRLKRFNCVITEYVDCKAVEDDEPVAANPRFDV